MAGGDGPSWPGPVTFHDDDPKKGFFTLFLTLKDMTVKNVVFGKNTSPNTVFNEDEDMFKDMALHVIGKVTTSKRGVVEYEYKKRLPEQINAARSSFKLKNDKIILSVCKSENVSWVQHGRLLIQKDV